MAGKKLVCAAVEQTQDPPITAIDRAKMARHSSQWMEQKRKEAIERRLLDEGVIQQAVSRLVTEVHINRTPQCWKTMHRPSPTV